MAKKIVVGHIVYNIGGESRELDVALTNSKKKTADFSKFVKSALGIGGAVVAFRSLIRIGKDLVQSYAAQEQAEAGLAAAIRATGGNVAALMIRYKDFASSIQAVTTIGDEQVLELIKQGEALGISRTRMEEATQGAIGLSKAFGIDMNTALRGVALAFDGNYAQLSRYIPALRTASTEAERQAVLQKAMANSFEIVKAETQTGSGAMLQYKNLIGDLKEEGGKAILDFMKPFIVEMNRTLSITLQNLQARRLLNRALKGEASSIEELDQVIKQNNDRRVGLLGLQKILIALNAKEIPLNKAIIAQGEKYGIVLSDLPGARQRAIVEITREIIATNKNAEALEAERIELEKLLGVKQEEAATPIVAPVTDAQLAARFQQQMDFINAQAENERQSIMDLNDFRLAQQDARLRAEAEAAAERVRIEKEADAQIQKAQGELMDFMVAVWGQLDSLNQSRLQSDLAALESQKQAELATFEGTEEEKQKLIADFEHQKAELEYESALKSWKLQVAGAVAALARSILEAAKNHWPIPALPMMALATIMGGIQLAAIRASKPVPSFQEGTDFIVPPGFENDTFPMNVESGERVTVTPADEVKSGPAFPSHITLRIGARDFDAMVEEELANGRIVLRGRARR